MQRIQQPRSAWLCCRHCSVKTLGSAVPAARHCVRRCGKGGEQWEDAGPLERRVSSCSRTSQTVRGWRGTACWFGFGWDARGASCRRGSGGGLQVRFAGAGCMMVGPGRERDERRTTALDWILCSWRMKSRAGSWGVQRRENVLDGLWCRVLNPRKRTWRSDSWIPW